MENSPAPFNRDKTSGLVIGGVLVLLGLLFLCGTVSSALLGFDLGLWRLWPFIFLVVSAAFFGPILLNWPRRQTMAGLAIPGSIFFMLFLIFAYSTWTDNWDAWAYLWAAIPLSVGLGMYLAYFLGDHSPGLFTGATIVSGVSLVMLVLFGVFAGGTLIRIVGPLLLIAAGIAFFLYTFFGGTARRG